MDSFFVLNAEHLHLVLNHVPTLGTAIALALLLLALVRRHDVLVQVGLETLFVIAVVTMPVYVTGAAAYAHLRDTAGFSDMAARLHQDAALSGFAVTEFAGFIAWVALWQARRTGQAGRGLVAAAVITSAIALAIMGRAATLGGEIRHAEIRPQTAAVQTLVGGGAETAASDQFVASRISSYMVNSTWAWPAAETIHFLGLSLSIAILLAINLRLLGVLPRVPFAELHRLLPWAMLGFGANLITGMLFFVGQPGQYVNSTPFHWKVVFLVVAGANFLYLTVFKKAWDTAGQDSRLADKAMAITSLAAWFIVLYAGRMLPFLGNAF